MSKPLLYDVFSGAGGASHGYQLAGFRVVGIDNRPQPRYKGDDFIEMDAFAFFDAVARGEYEQPAAWHASPPCQRYTMAQNAAKNAEAHPDFVAPVRERLRATKRPYVIENVVGAPLESAVTLCGLAFGLGVKRHRLFESNILLLVPPCPDHDVDYFVIFGHDVRNRRHGETAGRKNSIAQGRVAMDIDWMTRGELSEAIPPRYTEYVGRQLLQALAFEDEAMPESPAHPVSSGDQSGHVIQMGKKSTLPAFLARLRAAFPGARFAMSAANVALLGTAPDLEAHRRLRDDEAMILSEGQR